MRMIALAALLLTTAAAPPPPARVFIASDSTAQDYRADAYPQSGWGSMLRCAFGSEVTVENRAIGGRSTKSFIAEGRLDRIAAELKPGDTLLIQFGHNDASRDKPERYAAIPEFTANLHRFLAVAKAAGARPVLLTPVARRSFKHGVYVPSFAEYAAATRTVATATGTPLIDLARLSGRWIAAIGETDARRYYLHYTAADGVARYPEGIADDTHFSELGARGVADIIAGALATMKLPIASHVLRERPALKRTIPAGGPSCG